MLKKLPNSVPEETNQMVKPSEEPVTEKAEENKSEKTDPTASGEDYYIDITHPKEPNDTSDEQRRSQCNDESMKKWMKKVASKMIRMERRISSLEDLLTGHFLDELAKSRLLEMVPSFL